MSIRKILIFIIGALASILSACITIIYLAFSSVKFLDDCKERGYYSNKENFITEKAIVDSIIYNEEYERISFSLSEIDDLYQGSGFIIRGDSVTVLLERGIMEKVIIGSEITYTSAPGYFGNGYRMPIVAISVDGEELLSFDEGYENLMALY